MDDHQLQLQIPHFVYDTAPTLVPGGGAEVVPGANASWFIRNGFTPALIDSQFFSSQSPPHEDRDQPHESSSGPFDFSLPPPHTYEAPAQQRLPTPDLSVFLADPPPSLIAPSPLGLPVYSASGFDLLSILARVSTRPYPRVVLGPVDATCSFVVVDVRRFDHPIVYCSPSFCTLTGYAEQEVLGRNCRFLQAPGGEVRKGEPRQYTSQDAVNHLRKSLMADKECQSSILNYKKNGAAFINLVTVIPVPGGVSGDDQEIAYHVGFQVDLTEQPNAILEKLRDGSYLVNYAGQSDLAPFGPTGQGVQRQSASQHLSPSNARDRKTNAIPPIVISKDLKRLLADPAFIRSLPITPSAAAPVPAAAASSTLVDDSLATGVNHPLHMLLLEASPDFIHVVSLKGSFLYVAPSVRRVLGYESEEMIGTSIADYAHPEDVIPLMRELKESSATGPTANSGEVTTFSAQQGMPRNVDLLFRARTKMGRYVWVECRGRLHVEPGKGRKAIVLSGRAREMMNLRWEDVNRAGGLACGVRLQPPTDNTDKPVYQLVEQEVWGLLGGACKETATFLSVGRGMEDVLGWTPDELLGTRIADVVCDEAARDVLGSVIGSMRHCQQQNRLPKKERTRTDATRMKKIACKLRRKGGGAVDVWVVVYRADAQGEEEEQKSVEVERGAGLSISSTALIYQIRLTNAETISCGPDGGPVQALAMVQTPPSSSMSSSSLAGAVSLPSNTPSPSSSIASTSQLVDMFEELSVSRGSSWQYELQQLRITNLKLQEELVELEAAEAALQSQQQQLADQLSSPTYDASGLFDTPVYTDIPSHQLYIASPLRQMERYNSRQMHFDSQQRQKQQMPPSDQASLHHPQPVQQHYPPMHNMHYSPPPPPSSNPNSTSALPPPQLTAERVLAPAPVGREQQQQRLLHPRPVQKQASPMTWGPMVPPPAVGVYVNPGPAYIPSAASSLKRSWSNIDRQ